MKKSFTLPMVPLLVIFLFSCTSDDKKQALSLNQFEGLWQTDGNILLYEQWILIADSSLEGKSFSINGKDTVLSEKMRLAFYHDTLNYFANVSNQNNGREIAFKLVSTSNRKWVFENPVHDYPNRIIYHFENDSSMTARIENIRGNMAKEFHFIRVRP